MRRCFFLLFLLVVAASSRAEVEPLNPEDAPAEDGSKDSSEEKDESNLLQRHRRPLPVNAALEKKGEENPVPGDFRDADGDSVKIVGGKPGEFVHGFIATLSVILVSELGDKTFFIAAIMAMRHPRATVFAGAISALTVMHVMSAFFGYAITVIPRVYTYYVSSFLFAVFGIKMLKEGWKMSPNEAQEEMEEVQEDLRKRELDKEDKDKGDVETGGLSALERKISSVVWRVFAQSFTMTFLAEWGDRSQLATIVLAAREEIKSVVLGGILGHSLCTGLAVLGGRFIAQRISVRTVTLVGGVVFLMFAATALFMDPNET